ncbi:MAG: adenylate/guanylate cyclase domain-containing protein [Desulfomonilaceae bacterium]
MTNAGRDSAEGLETSEKLYQRRFDNLFRVAMKITSSLNISTILEVIRDEAKATLPHVKEVCLLLLDPEAANYTRPLRCAMNSSHINCQLCKRGRFAVDNALQKKNGYICFEMDSTGCELVTTDEPTDGLSEVALPIYHGGQALAVLDVIAKEECKISQMDLVLLKDLAELTSNVIMNARKHWKVAQEKITLDQILGHLRPFVPQTVQKIVEKDPLAPSLEKREVDVTVLFIDVAGYSHISESLTQEQVNFVIEKYFSSYLDILYQYDGDINETAGDGLMVIFQGPSGKNAINSARAALGIRKRTESINIELKGRFQPVNIHMGMNSGAASVGTSRFQGRAGARTTFTATGPLTNLAARLAAVSEPGQILVGPETARRINGLFRLEKLGPMTFKNIKNAVEVYNLSGSLDTSSQE